MGRLSDARKKAKGGTPSPAPAAAAPKPGPAPMPERAPAGEAVKAVSRPAPSAPVADESFQLPSSGLADEILAGVKAAPEPASNAAAHLLEDDVLAALMTAESPLPAVPASLPASGLADEILGTADRPAAKSSLGIDEIHDFEAFFEEDRTAEYLQLVMFGMASEMFALEIDRVQEIIRVPAITRVPHAGANVRGVCNLRGRIVPVLDLRRMMRLEARPVDRFSRIMVIDIAGKRLGVLIDRVNEVARVRLADVEPPPEEVRAVDSNLVTAVARQNEKMVFILDVDRVLALR